MTRHHLVVSIAGLKRQLEKNEGWQVLMNDDGIPLTMYETFEEIKSAEELGYTVIPMCDNIDERGHCKGHES